MYMCKKYKLLAIASSALGFESAHLGFETGQPRGQTRHHRNESLNISLLRGSGACLTLLLDEGGRNSPILAQKATLLRSIGLLVDINRNNLVVSRQEIQCPPVNYPPLGRAKVLLVRHRDLDRGGGISLGLLSLGLGKDLTGLADQEAAHRGLDLGGSILLFHFGKPHKSVIILLEFADILFEFEKLLVTPQSHSRHQSEIFLLRNSLNRLIDIVIEPLKQELTLPLEIIKDLLDGGLDDLI